MLILLKRVIQSGCRNFSRNGGSAIATIFIIAMTISLVTSLFLLKDISRFLILSIQEKVDVSVYFKQEAQEEDILKVKEKITEISEIKEVEYVSKEEALKIFTERHQDNPVLIESLEEVGQNPFLASLNIKAFEASQYGAVTNFLENSNFENLIEKIDYHQRKPVIERIFSLTSGINKAGIGFSIVLGIIAILVVFNTIRLAIYNSKEEIKIQKLVGASNWFIRGPFLVQGVIAGFIAALICLSVFSLLTWGFSSKIEILFPGLNIFSLFIVNFWLIFLIQLVTGIGLGVISSLIAVRKYSEA